MKAFNQYSRTVIPMNRVNIDTDQIIPAVYLKRIERDGNGEFLFARWRYNDCLLYTSPSPRDGLLSRMPSSA